MATPILILPGLSDSGPKHWQTHWEEKHPEFIRVTHRDWYDPEPAEWLDSIDQAIRNCDMPPVVVAHSLGCVALAHWVRLTAGQLSGAMLVAPADAERTDTPHDISKFAPLPRVRFAFPSILVASTNDPWCTFDRAQTIAALWGSKLVNAGACGHINVAAGFGPWPEGERLLRDHVAHTRSRLEVRRP